MNIGERVDEDTVEHYINVLPPATYNGEIIQIGEAYSHEMDAEGKYRATYPTLAKVDGHWTYAGNCFRGQKENQD